MRIKYRNYELEYIKGFVRSIILNGEEVGVDDANPNEKSFSTIEDAIQWIDEDIKWRNEENVETTELIYKCRNCGSIICEIVADYDIQNLTKEFDCKKCCINTDTMKTTIIADLTRIIKVSPIPK